MNDFNLDEIGLPPTGSLKLDRRDQPADAVVKAESHFEELVTKLHEFNAFLKSDGGWSHEAAQETARYLEILSSHPNYQSMEAQQDGSVDQGHGDPLKNYVS